MKKTALIICLLCMGIVAGNAQVTLTDKALGKNAFPLVTSSAKTVVCYDSEDATVIKTSVALFVDDVEKVTGKKIGMTGGELPKSANYAVIVGTVGNSRVIDDLVAKGKIDVKEIEGGWERYVIELVDRPMPGIRKAVVVAGSDRRGAAFGLLSISRTIGVSPWYWWADVPVEKHSQLVLNVDKFVSKEPSVKFRGIFINDEDWGIYRWSKNTFEKDLGNMGPKTYTKICELLLRLNANHLAPGMHNATMAFHKIAENRVVADSFAITMGSSHCEPLLLNTATEWDKKTMGEWDYVNNKEGVDKVLKKRVVEAAPYENVYTLALRGLHDTAMKGSDDMEQRKKTMQEALYAQRKILEDVIGKPATEIPQAFTPYKEVLDVYNEGLDLPDDVTIIWPDDNYGYMKRLSGPKEQQRSGRSGVYYHASYLGKPHSYLWMNTTSPSLMYEELKKAYDMTADRVWLLNAGDLKSAEFAVDFFLEMAYDIDAFNFERVSQFQAEWLSHMFGEKYYEELADISNSFFHQAFIRKPEFMGWGYQFNSSKFEYERNTDTDFSFTNYREAENRIAEYKRIAGMAERIMNELPEEQKPAFYQLVYYPVKGCELMSRMVLAGQKNRWYAIQQRAATQQYADIAKACFDSLAVITKGYNSLLDGKWNHIVMMEQGAGQNYFKLPVLRKAELEEGASLGVMAEREDILKGAKSFHSLPAFNTYLRQSYYVDVFNKGKAPLKWTASVSDNWIVLSKKDGNTATEDRIEVSIDWNTVPVGERVFGTVEIKAANGEKESVYVSVFNPSSPSLEEMAGLFVEDNGYISINAADFHRKVENDKIKISIIPNLGVENECVQLGDPVMPKQTLKSSDVPRVEYDFYTYEQGSVDVYTYVLPTFVISADRGYAGHEQTNLETQYGVMIDNGPVMIPSTSSIEYAQIWYESALKNCRVNKTTLHIDKPGKHTLKILCGDAGTMFQKAVIDFGGMQRSYIGPRPTKK